eukprot:TRINITY_DN5631_c1_g1_i1.p1 TRINITY_DN5631_c1_g1~~TRINITY_DN5631_c1_g1_i1.p1  ORF type:complete len:552 (+),score=201.36 TRINITY_DN5631_c1_g1_i1:64-1719(+)
MASPARAKAAGRRKGDDDADVDVRDKSTPAADAPLKIPRPVRRRRPAGAKASIGFVIGCVDSSSDVTNHTHSFPAPDCYKVCMRKFGRSAVCGAYGPFCTCAPADRKLRLFGDAAAALALQHSRPDLHVDIMYPRQVTAARVAANDMTFLLGYDAVSCQLDSTNGDVSMVTPKQAKAFIDAVQSPGAKVYPGPVLQAFGCCKRTYYQRAMDTGVPIAPTKFARTAGERSAKALVAAARSAGWKNFVVKPAVGSWNDGVEDFNLAKKGESAAASEERVLEELEKHLQVPSVVKSPDLVIQKCMAGFEQHPEVRCFWADGELLYAVSNWRNGVRGSIQKCKVPERYLSGAKEIGKMVIERMLPEKPLGLIRTDIACETEAGGKLKFFMNEVDTCPGWYADRYPACVSVMTKMLSAASDRVGTKADVDVMVPSDKEDEPKLERRPSKLKRARRKPRKDEDDDSDADSMIVDATSPKRRAPTPVEERRLRSASPAPRAKSPAAPSPKRRRVSPEHSPPPPLKSPSSPKKAAGGKAQGSPRSKAGEKRQRSPSPKR